MFDSPHTPKLAVTSMSPDAAWTGSVQTLSAQSLRDNYAFVMRCFRQHKGELLSTYSSDPVLSQAKHVTEPSARTH